MNVPMHHGSETRKEGTAGAIGSPSHVHACGATDRPSVLGIAPRMHQDRSRACRNEGRELG